MSEYITEIHVSLNKDEEEALRSTGCFQNPVNLNKRTGGDQVYLWYKKGTDKPITRLQLTFSDTMSQGLIDAQYTKIKKNLNSKTGGGPIYLWYKQGSDVPIVDLFVTTEQEEEPQLLHLGYERLACNLNRMDSACRIFLWVKREKPTYVSAITATSGFKNNASLFKKGFLRVDENVNRGAGGDQIFLWYTLTPDEKNALGDLAVSVNKEQEEELKNKNFTKVPQDLNEGTGGNKIYVWYKSNGPKPIKTITVIPGPIYMLPYKRAGANVIERNLNTGNEGAKEYLCFYQ